MDEILIHISWKMQRSCFTEMDTMYETELLRSFSMGGKRDTVELAFYV